VTARPQRQSLVYKAHVSISRSPGNTARVLAVADLELTAAPQQITLDRSSSTVHRAAFSAIRVINAVLNSSRVLYSVLFWDSPVFRRGVSLPSSGSKSKPTKKPGQADDKLSLLITPQNRLLCRSPYTTHRKHWKETNICSVKCTDSSENPHATHNPQFDVCTALMKFIGTNYIVRLSVSPLRGIQWVVTSLQSDNEREREIWLSLILNIYMNFALRYRLHSACNVPIRLHCSRLCRRSCRISTGIWELFWLLFIVPIIIGFNVPFH
jgi:hypothetical protein